MPATVQEIEQLIQEGFPNSVIKIEKKDHRVMGTILWPEFREMDPLERNRLVTKRVRDPLGLRGTNLGFLLPLAAEDEV